MTGSAVTTEAELKEQPGKHQGAVPMYEFLAGTLWLASTARDCGAQAEEPG
jgi:hypothetical protein